MSVGSVLAAPASAHVLVQQAAASSYTVTSERIWASTAAVLALIGVVLGWLALARSTGRIRTGNGRAAAIVAMAAGLIAVVNGGLVVVTADGGPGTGNGMVGGFVAVVIGLIGVVLGRRALARSHRTA
ncbi:DUF6223 family protein [Streptomyces sp. NPDC051020]|uniref:DUF6223 family protein n=1 Tax=Streptomyces sp. NPDC051020 TaxID=3155409 RepID=UPI003438B61E